MSAGEIASDKASFSCIFDYRRVDDSKNKQCLLMCCTDSFCRAQIVISQISISRGGESW